MIERKQIFQEKAENFVFFKVLLHRMHPLILAVVGMLSFQADGVWHSGLASYTEVHMPVV